MNISSCMIDYKSPAQSGVRLSREVEHMNKKGLNKKKFKRKKFCNLLMVVSVWKLAERLATESRGIARGLPIRLLTVGLLICLVPNSFGILSSPPLLVTLVVGGQLLATVALIARWPLVPFGWLIFVSQGLSFTGIWVFVLYLSTGIWVVALYLSTSWPLLFTAPWLLVGASITSMASDQTLPCFKVLTWLGENIGFSKTKYPFLWKMCSSSLGSDHKCFQTEALK